MVLVLSPNGEYTKLATLEEARTSPFVAGKTVVVTTPLTEAQSNITAAWPADRALKIEKGGSIANSTAFSINGPFSAGNYQVFAGSGSVVFRAGSAINPEWKSGTDTEKVQWAVTTSGTSGWIPLAINRKYTLTAPITIDRAVDTTSDEFRIIGQGLNAGFHTASAIDMFSSSIAHTNDPVSEHVSFEGIRFSADSAATDCFVVDGDKFLRMKFNNCYFYGIRLATTVNYYQSYRVTGNSYLIGWKGVFLGTTAGGVGTYAGFFIDTHFDNFSAEFGTAAGAGGSKIIVSTGPLSGSSFTNSLAENFDGPAISTYAFTGSNVSGNHFEAIVEPALKLGITNSLSHMGNTYVSGTPGWYAVDCETALNVYSGGNYSSHNMFDDLTMTRGLYDGIHSKGDVTNGNLYNGIKSNHLKQVGALTGMTATVQQYFYISRDGNTISISWDNITGTSNATTMTLTGVIPTQWLPVTQRSIIVPVQDNGTILYTGMMVIWSTGVTFYSAATASPFTNSGTKGLVRNTISYNLMQ